MKHDNILPLLGVASRPVISARESYIDWYMVSRWEKHGSLFKYVTSYPEVDRGVLVSTVFNFVGGQCLFMFTYSFLVWPGAWHICMRKGQCMEI